MNKNLFRHLAALLLISVSASASASTIDFGIIDPGSSSATFFAEGPTEFTDTIRFSLERDLRVGIAIDANDEDPLWRIEDFLAVANGIPFTFDEHDNAYGFYGELRAGNYEIN